MKRPRDDTLTPPLQPRPLPIFFGIDMSLTSPGICAYAKHTSGTESWELLQLFFVPTKKKDRDVATCVQRGNTTYQIIPIAEGRPIPASLSTKQRRKIKNGKDPAKIIAQFGLNVRYQNMLDAVDRSLALGRQNALSWLRQKSSSAKECSEPPLSSSYVAIEGYAYNANMGGSAKLHELGGMVKQKLFAKNIQFLEVSPTSIKKFFCGRGDGDKAAMYRSFRARHPGLELLQIFGYGKLERQVVRLDTPNPASESPNHSVRGRPAPTSVPNPVQDLVDAAALALRASECYKTLGFQRALDSTKTLEPPLSGTGGRGPGEVPVGGNSSRKKRSKLIPFL